MDGGGREGGLKEQTCEWLRRTWLTGGLVVGLVDTEG